MSFDPDRFADRGDPVAGQACPRCQNFTVVYNGNYFCTHCTWAMPESGLPKRIVVAYLIQKREAAMAAGDQDEVARMDFYLLGYDGETTR